MAQTEAGDPLVLQGSWPGQTRARLRQLLESPTNTGRLRGDGNGEGGAASEDRWTRHAGPSHLRSRAVPGCCLICLLSRLFAARPKLCNTTPDSLFNETGIRIGWLPGPKRVHPSPYRTGYPRDVR